VTIASVARVYCVVCICTGSCYCHWPSFAMEQFQYVYLSCCFINSLVRAFTADWRVFLLAEDFCMHRGMLAFSFRDLAFCRVSARRRCSLNELGEIWHRVLNLTLINEYTLNLSLCPMRLKLKICLIIFSILTIPS